MTCPATIKGSIKWCHLEAPHPTEGWPLARCSVHNLETENCSSGMRNQRKRTYIFYMSCYHKGVSEGDSGAIWEGLTQLKVGHLHDVVCII